MEVKLDNMEKHMNYLYDELDAREKEIDALNETVKKLNAKKDSKCQNQCERMEEVMKYAEKNKNDALKVKEIATSQKEKIFCLRSHRNELFDRIDDLNEKYGDEIKAKDETIKLLEIDLVAMRKKVNDQEDEIENKSKDIEGFKKQFNLKASSKSLQTEIDELHDVNENEQLKKKIEVLEKKEKVRRELLEKMEKIAEQRTQQIESLEIQIKSRHIENKRCIQGWSCRRTFCDHNHSFLYSIVNHHQEKSLCYICGKIFESRKYLDTHIEEYHVEQNIQNKMEFPELAGRENCEESFQSKADLTLHQTEEYNNLDKNDQSHEVQQHPLKHKNTEVCLKCDKVFPDNDFLLLHMITAHEGMGLLEKDTINDREPDIVVKEKQDTEQDFQCMLCSSRFNSKSSLKKHKRKMHRVNKENTEPRTSKKVTKEDYGQTFECKLCREEFIGSEEMNHHMDQMHEGRWKYGDSDVISEGDEYVESSSSSYIETDESFENEEFTDNEATESDHSDSDTEA